ncbi:hypothetical protein BH23ACT5_BH23ACT5_08360 [soil metagenome]
MMARDDLHRVVLAGIPVEVWARSREWFNGLIREFDVIASGTDLGSDATPSQMVTFVAETSEKFARFNQTEPLLDQAIADGDVELDLDLLLPPEAGEAARELWRLIEKADAYCVSDDLLTLAIPEEVRRFARWYLFEVARQVDGQESIPWSRASHQPGFL